MTTPSQNEVLLEGTPLASPEWSHENHGTHFYRFFLQVPRLSGTPDILPVLLAEPQASLIEALRRWESPGPDSLWADHSAGIR